MAANEAKKILLLGGKERLVPPVHKAQAMGHFVIVADGNPHAAAFRHADLAAHCDISDAQAIADLAEQHHVDGVLSLSEFGVVAAATARQRLGLPGISLAAARNATDKFRMRSAWQAAGHRQPWFHLVKSQRDAEETLNSFDLPIICKPRFSCAGRGVSLVRSRDEFDQAYQWASHFDPQDHVILEQFIDGTELNCESVIRDGKLELLAVADKVIECTGSSAINWSIIYSPESPPDRDGLEHLLNQAASTLGLDSGICHCEVIVVDGRYWLLEMAARGGGGHIYTTIVEHCSGFDFVSASIRLALGESVAGGRSRDWAAGYEFLPAAQGKLLDIHGVEQASAVPGVHEVGFAYQAGDTIGEVRHSADRPGWIVALAESRAAVLAAIEAAARPIEFIVEKTP